MHARTAQQRNAASLIAREAFWWEGEKKQRQVFTGGQSRCFCFTRTNFVSSLMRFVLLISTNKHWRAQSNDWWGCREGGGSAGPMEEAEASCQKEEVGRKKSLGKRNRPWTVWCLRRRFLSYAALLYIALAMVAVKSCIVANKQRPQKRAGGFVSARSIVSNQHSNHLFWFFLPNKQTKGCPRNPKQQGAMWSVDAGIIKPLCSDVVV